MLSNRRNNVVTFAVVGHTRDKLGRNKDRLADKFYRYRTQADTAVDDTTDND
jgi:hypothetical protein